MTVDSSAGKTPSSRPVPLLLASGALLLIAVIGALAFLVEVGLEHAGQIVSVPLLTCIPVVLLALSLLVRPGRLRVACIAISLAACLLLHPIACAAFGGWNDGNKSYGVESYEVLKSELGAECPEMRFFDLPDNRSTEGHGEAECSVLYDGRRYRMENKGYAVVLNYEKNTGEGDSITSVEARCIDVCARNWLGLHEADPEEVVSLDGVDVLLWCGDSVDDAVDLHAGGRGERSPGSRCGWCDAECADSDYRYSVSVRFALSSSETEQVHEQTRTRVREMALELIRSVIN